MYVHKTLKIVWFCKPIKTKNLASGLELLSCKLLVNQVAVAIKKHRHELYHARKAWAKTLVRPLTSLWK
jgi:hypothetical protein